MNYLRITAWAALGVITSAALAYDVNKDLQNVGSQPAYDIAVVLAGQEQVTGHYDGYSGRQFTAFSSGPSGPNTLLHWQNLFEPSGDGAIDPGEVVHVGWTTADHSSQVLDMYWTDQSGNRIPGSKIFNITTGWSYETGWLMLTWDNIFVTQTGETGPIEITDVAVGFFPQLWPLSELNAQNEELNGALQPLPDGTFVVDPGQPVTLRVPATAPEGSAAVVRYQVTGPGDSAQAVDWVQIEIPPPPPPPTRFVNKDLQNTGSQSAYDLAVVLQGDQTISGHYDGYSDRYFGSFTVGSSGSNTLLHWQNLVEPGGNGAIDPGEIVHVGWGTATATQVVDMYWTDEAGNRIPGSRVFNIISDTTYGTGGVVVVSWDNVFVAEGEVFPIDIGDVSVGVFPDPWPLSELNLRNEALNGALQPLPDGSFVVAPDQPVRLTLPDPVPDGSALVLRYGVSGAGDSALATDFVQIISPPPPPPTYFVNKDLENTGGQPAYDLAVVLEGQQTISGHYDGYVERQFGSFTVTPSGSNTLLHWQNLVEPGGNGAIDPGEIVHVGWRTQTASHVVDMYWTDQSGNRIPGSRVFNITSDTTYGAGGVVVVSWDNIFVAEGEVFPIDISDVSVGVFPDPWPLSELNLRNEALNGALQPLPDGTFVVAPDQPVRLTLPDPVPEGSALVLRYGVSGAGDSALATDFVQIISPPPPPPTYFVNKDLENTGGQPAYDLAVVLEGQQTISGHYDGYVERQFGSFTVTPSGSNTLLHWQNLTEPGGNGAIDPGEIVHVGWRTQTASHVVDMYWTDQAGNRIPGSRVFNITSDTTYGTGGVVVVSWDNIFVAEGEVFPIDISDVSVGVFPDPWPLSELNLRNEALNGALQPLPDGSFVVAPDQPVRLTLPDPVPEGSALVLRYGVSGAGDSALATDFVQIISPPPPPPPPSYFVNKDLQNIGSQSAYDLAIVLAGQQTIGAHYDGYSDRHFGSFSYGPSGPNTLLHWQNLAEPGGNGAIDPGEIVHVGWGTAGPSHVLDMYWTDQSGNRIPGSKIFNITSDWTYETSGVVTVTWDNIFVTDTGEVFPIDINDVSVAVFTDPWPLSELNAQNDVLNGALQPLPDGSFVVAPDQPVTLTLPMPVPAGSAVVLRYGVTGAGDEADAMDWVQFITPPPTTGACCISTSCEGDMSADECAAIGGEWNAGQACGVFVCPGEEIRCTPGDVNGDGLINGYDIDPFVAVLVGTVTDPDWLCSADANGDGLVNGYDIDPFVNILTSGGAVTVGYEHACDGRNYTWSVNAPVGRCYLVTAAKDVTESDCPVTVQAHDDTHRVIGGSLVLQPGLSGEFCMPEGATHLDYRCQSSSGHTCRFSWQAQ